jgi:hypothetical protein
VTGKFLVVVAALSLTVAATGLARLRPALATEIGLPDSQMQMEMTGPDDQGIPSYHAYAPESPLPATLDPKGFAGDVLNRNVYAMAAKIRPVLYQQPCYCYCDRSIGHKSLLDCYMSRHASQCTPCQKEAVFAYLQTQKGKTPAQIRAAIIHGDWKSVDMKPYMASPR